MIKDNIPKAIDHLNLSMRAYGITSAAVTSAERTGDLLAIHWQTKGRVPRETNICFGTHDGAQQALDALTQRCDLTR